MIDTFLPLKLPLYQAELDVLERRWRRRLEIQQQESAKKAVAAAAAAASIRPEDADTGLRQQSTILQTASWLDRANTVMTDQPLRDIDSLPQSEIVNQIQEVQRLLQENPQMQRASSFLPDLVDRSGDHGTGPAQMASKASSPPPEPADKRPRTGTEDAEALVGFLRSVRASAAAGREF